METKFRNLQSLDLVVANLTHLIELLPTDLQRRMLIDLLLLCPQTLNIIFKFVLPLLRVFIHRKGQNLIN